GAAEAHEFALLNHTQQLSLRFRADGRDFVKENRALIRHFEQTLFRGYGARKGALYVTKKLRFQKIDGNGSGVHGHKGSVRSRRDRKSTRLNSSHVEISYAVFCLKKKKKKKHKKEHL